MALFEDDIVFQRFDAGRLRQGLAFLYQQDRWQVFFLGGLIDGSRATECAAVQCIAYRSLAHAYVINRPFDQTLAGQLWRGTP